MDDYNESGRSRWLRIGAFALAGLVLVVVAFGVGRWSATLRTEPSTGTPVVHLNGPGPTRTENGVPVGYAHTADGAVAAATNFLTVVAGPLLAQPEKYRAAIDTLSMPEARVKLRAGAEARMTAMQSVIGLVSNAQQGRAVIFRTVPLTYHVDAYTDGRAQVSIWAESLVAVDSVYAPRASWATDVYVVQWLSGDWRLVSIDDPTAGSPGPVPVTGPATTQTASLPVQIKDFKEYHGNASP
jgi:hypothetical protein